MSTITGSLALFFIIWWTTLFAILPFWVRSQAEDDGEGIPAGTEPGAPQHPQLLRKILVNTAVSILVFVVVSIIVNSVDL
ncbi:MAG: DUF1467 family protein [Chelatococcus sp.]|nr:DUF1467 family protein [Chelatococcus sp. YT9]MBX3557624.1 DUF1467 family protein [Chelatococcus sp.]